MIEISSLSFTYPEESGSALSSVSLHIQPGQFVVLCGPSGCGKTTLLRHLIPELAPVGQRSGQVKLLADEQQIALVQQDPENQIVMERVLQELTFGLENQGLSTAAMRQKVAEMAHCFGLEDWLHRPTHELSGGQKQLLNLASVLLLQPKVLLLDEPTAQLDPVAARQFLQMVYLLNQEYGMTVLMTEHRLEELFPLADRFVMMERGRIKYEGAPGEVISSIGMNRDEEYAQYLPGLARLVLATGEGHGPVPLTLKEGRAWLAGRMPPSTAEAHPPAGSSTSGNPAAVDRRITATSASAQLQAAFRPSGGPLLQCKEITFQYERTGPAILRQLDFTVGEGELLAILGGNGAGKSTLLQLLAGLLSPWRGKVLLEGRDLRLIKDKERYQRIGYLAQNPLSYFLYDTVRQELVEATRRNETPDHSQETLIRQFGLDRLLDKHPHDLSGGERQKAVLACILLSGAKLLLLDEPTKGLDPAAKREWGELLLRLHEQGLTIVIVTHDVEFAARYASRCAMLFDGAMTSEGPPAGFFSDNYFYTTTINRLFRDRHPGLLTYEDVLALWSSAPDMLSSRP